MSTPFLVRLAFHAGVGTCFWLSACSDAPPVDASVSYVGLDTPNHATPFAVGIQSDLTGLDPAAGRAFSDALSARFAAESARANSPDLRVHIFDDRGTPVGIRSSAARLERDPGVHLGLVAAGSDRAAIVTELAPNLVVVCVGCPRNDAAREGSFAFTETHGAESAVAAAEWIVTALAKAREPSSRDVAEALRATQPPAGYAWFEGAAPSSDPFAFRRPQAIKK